MEAKTGSRRAWITGAVIVTTVGALLLRRQQKRRRLAQQSAMDATHAALDKALRESLLPVLVRPEALPAGWGVAPPVFYPPHCAAIPLVLPSEMHEIERSSRRLRAASTAPSERDTDSEAAAPPSAFLFCSHTGCTAAAFETAQDEEVFLAEMMAHHPLLHDRLSQSPGQWSALPVFAPEAATLEAPSTATAPAAAAKKSSVARTFTHVLIGDEYVVLAGLNGPYAAVAVLTGFAGTWPPPATPATPADASATASADGGSKRRTAAAAPATAEELGLATAIEGITRATVNVPLKPQHGNSVALSSRVPGCSFAAHHGHYRVVCTRDGQELELCVPCEWTVRSRVMSPPQSTPGVPRETNAAAAQKADAAENLLTLVFSPSAFAAEGSVEVPVTADVFAALLANPQVAAATLWAASGATDASNPVARATLAAATARPLAASSRAQANVLTMVYVQPKFGVLFSVQPHSSVVYEPWMTDLPTVLYYPLGDGAEPGEPEASEEEPPKMSIEYVVELPKTWEVLAADEEEFVHNVLFHFTNWEAATVSTTLLEISGIRCAMFHETRDGRRCRTYVLPRAATVLIIRWEAPVSTWDRYLPVFQQTLDTLHIDAAAITQ